MIQSRIQPFAEGAILYDAATLESIAPDWFEPPGAAESASMRGGRGGVVFFDAPFGACVLRPYRRGGLAAHVSADRYLWTGAERTRAFREFRLLAQLHDAGLPVPRPVAAAYWRDGLHYRATLVTRRIEATRTLAERLASEELDTALGGEVGATIARFHAAGAWHADLNAHNVLADTHGKVWLIDFDRGRLRHPARRWQRANVERLARSFAKLGAHRRLADFTTRFWHPLLAAYHERLAESA